MEKVSTTDIRVLPGDFTVCKVADFSEVVLDAPYCFTARTDQELSVVCATPDAPRRTLAREDGWMAFRIEGVLDFSLIGILAKVSTLLAEQGIGLFAVSTYNTDYFFIKKENETRALAALTEAGYTLLDG